MTTPTPTQPTPFPLRMPPELRERLEARAKKNGRSANAEIVSMVKAALEGASGLAAATSGELLDEVVNRYGAKVQIVVTPEVAAQASIKPKRKKAK
ncbi:MAG TPA: Arc family DNA-binding protein [Telluria sp.]